MINQLKKILLAGVIITSISNHICAADTDNAINIEQFNMNIKNKLGKNPTLHDYVIAANYAIFIADKNLPIAITKNPTKKDNYDYYRTTANSCFRCVQEFCEDKNIIEAKNAFMNLYIMTLRIVASPDELTLETERRLAASVAAGKDDSSSASAASAARIIQDDD